MYSQDRQQMRQVFLEVRKKQRAKEPLSPLEALMEKVIDQHPEYHPFLDHEESLQQEFSSQNGQENPFLHMALHISLQEQIQVDRPPGIRKTYQMLVARSPDLHQAEHRMMECLAQMLWQAQSSGSPPSEETYLDCLRRLL
ncbi:conserved hypothetical protein [Nitrosococcus oceani ATCC 19707]|uniref:DUF1841 domain-containing protein n=2 Tax=Nitrosococcus oceani TaxID=1229 RepID=Q3JBX5_NITOC|nr:DUF1841 family protein [Nitrosococcus oceani]ABA57671.1 conserved hypothetical protein [Nitrosococcus oceani ATCC 19707]EDZ68212.1 conserved domain protein [Nitrosococcus oceani AFC27]KFI19959.1 hypothetical protein IB75_06080 [Nitrosococcus oceani C-27]GEM19319.1 hypothetical protein NONS58_07030 [Nitrosococcus oceani]